MHANSCAYLIEILWLAGTLLLNNHAERWDKKELKLYIWPPDGVNNELWTVQSLTDQFVLTCFDTRDHEGWVNWPGLAINDD